MLGMFEWMVVFHLRNTWRFSTYQKFFEFFLDPFFSKFSKNLVFKRIDIRRGPSFCFLEIIFTYPK